MRFYEDTSTMKTYMLAKGVDDAIFLEKPDELIFLSFVSWTSDSNAQTMLWWSNN